MNELNINTGILDEIDQLSKDRDMLIKEQFELNWFTARFEYNEDKTYKRFKSVTIHPFKFCDFLMTLGFYRYEKDGVFFTVRINNNIVEVCNQNNIIDVVQDFINRIPGEKVTNGKQEIHKHYLFDKLYSGIVTYFSDSLLNRCRKDGDFVFLEDTKEKAYFFYTNCIVEVTENGIKTLDYSKAGNKYIWKNQILNREFEVLKLREFIDCPTAQFVTNISSLNEEVNGSLKSDQRLDAIMSIIGYNCHKFYEGKLKATVLTDSTISDNPNGRTGKTLLIRLIGQMLNTNKESKTFVELNGKVFKLSDPKRYQELEIDTKLVHINDLRKNFPIDEIYPDISDGLKVVQHYKTPYTILVKIILSTNMTIKLYGDSSLDRVVEFEMSNYYSKNFSPLTEFGHWFFTEWDETQYLHYDNFMLYCVKFYLKNGLLEPNTINLNTRKLYTETAKEFVTYMDEELEKNRNKTLLKKDLYERFKEDNSDFNRKGPRELTQRTFTEWCRLYAKYKDEIESVDETRSNGKDSIRFIPAS